MALVLPSIQFPPFILYSYLLIPLSALAFDTTVILLVVLVVDMLKLMLSTLAFEVRVVLLLTVYLSSGFPTLELPLYHPSMI